LASHSKPNAQPTVKNPRVTQLAKHLCKGSAIKKQKK
jgi:hypothetical protein